MIAAQCENQLTREQLDYLRDYAMMMAHKFRCAKVTPLSEKYGTSNFNKSINYFGEILENIDQMISEHDKWDKKTR